MLLSQRLVLFIFHSLSALAISSNQHLRASVHLLEEQVMVSMK
jgi:hypothetical protein